MMLFLWVTWCRRYYKIFGAQIQRSFQSFISRKETRRAHHHHRDVCPDDPHGFKEFSPTHRKPQRRRHMKGVCVDVSAHVCVCACLRRSLLARCCECVCEILSMSQRSRSLKITRGDWCEVPGFFLLFIL